ncbi:MAG: twin-arginine translocation signal domain-containing protein, partial [Xanthobacteraceae bacterium]|nr:twin-arginine translocation signal domain-containing protein [Xanthobacteraceae bacterium]
MRAAKLSRRDMLKASGAAAATVFATPLRAAPPEATAITPALIDAATKEGKIVYYTSIDLPVSE